MLKNKLLILIILLSCLSKLYAGTCTIKISDRVDFFKKNFPQEMNYFLSLEFEINDSKIKTINSDSIHVKINDIEFDTIKYFYKNHQDKIIRETFICKLKPGETYSISPCTCCGIFLMTPSKNPKRGFVKFKNNSQQEFLSVSSEFDYDTIPKLSNTNFIPSMISMNCGFRPNRIFIANFNYQNEKYQYENWSTKSTEEKKALELEQESHIIFNFNYLFLHEEKLVVKINGEANKFKVELSE